MCIRDSFGSGYSSLNMLKEAPVDQIKLDMRFLSEPDPYGLSLIHILYGTDCPGLLQRKSQIGAGGPAG